MKLDFDQVDAIFSALVASGHAPGIAYGVIADGDLVHCGGAGVGQFGSNHTPDQDSVFRIASLTKSFTASAVLRLRDAGALNLDDTVATYLPEVAAAGLPTVDSPPLTIRHLLTMSAGLPTDDAWADRQESMTQDAFAALLRGGIGFTSAPGTAFEYSNLGFAMLGRVVTEVAGREYRDEVVAALLTPLGMRQTAFTYRDADASHLTCGYRHGREGWVPLPFDRPGVFSAIGGLYSSVADLARWVSGFVTAFPARDEPDDHPLSRASRRDMQQLHRFVPSPPVLGIDGSHAWASTGGYGYGLFVEEHPTGSIISHPGGYPGYGAHMRWSTTVGVGVIALANATYAPVHQPAAEALAALLSGFRRPTSTPWPATLRAAHDVSRLLTSWDDDVADKLFAPNVDLDVPRDERRDQFDAARASVGYGPNGPLGDAERATHPTPAAAAWVTPGSHGWISVDVQLSPQLPAQVQTVVVKVVGEPSPRVTSAAADLLKALNSVPPRWPTELAYGNDVDPGRLLSAATAARAVDGPFGALGELVDCMNPDSVAYQLRTATASWHLFLAIDPDTGALTRAELRPAGLLPTTTSHAGQASPGSVDPR